MGIQYSHIISTINTIANSQAETNVNDDGEKKTVKIPIAVLKVGETRSLRPNVEFPNGSVTFKLVQGTGPVYVCGKVIINNLIKVIYEA